MWTTVLTGGVTQLSYRTVRCKLTVIFRLCTIMLLFFDIGWRFFQLNISDILDIESKWCKLYAFLLGCFMCSQKIKISSRIAVQSFEVVYGPRNNLCKVSRRSVPNWTSTNTTKFRNLRKNVNKGFFIVYCWFRLYHVVSFHRNISLISLKTCAGLHCKYKSCFRFDRKAHSVLC